MRPQENEEIGRSFGGPVFIRLSALKEATVKKLKKLQLKKVTLRDLDEPTMQGMAGGQDGKHHTSAHTCPATCPNTCAHTCVGCGGGGGTGACTSIHIVCTNLL